MTRPTLVVDKEFSSLCWTQTEEEIALLTESLKEEGCREPVRYWQQNGQAIIIDGMTRKSICEKLKIDFPAEAMQFEDRRSAIIWILRNQLGRRNVSEIQKANLRGRLYLERQDAKEAQSCEGGDTLSPLPPKSKADKDVSTQNLSAKNVNLAANVAEETGVSERQIHRDVEFAKAMKTLGDKSPKLRDAALRGTFDKKDAVALATASPELLKSIEKTPETDWRGAVKQTAKQILGHRKQAPNGKPVVDLRPLADMEKKAGELVRLKTAALKACGGKGGWASGYEKAIREALNTIFEQIMAWQKEAERRRNK